MLSMGNGGTEKDLFEIIRRQSEQIDQLMTLRIRNLLFGGADHRDSAVRNAESGSHHLNSQTESIEATTRHPAPRRLAELGTNEVESERATPTVHPESSGLGVKGLQRPFAPSEASG